MRLVQTNMRVLSPSRKKNGAGSVFALWMLDGLFSFGRLVNKVVNAGMGPGAQLIYVFKYRSESKDLPHSPNCGPRDSSTGRTHGEDP